MYFQVKKIPDAGPVYGRLSETSHLHFEETLSYIEFQDDELAIRLHDYRLCAIDAILLLNLIDWLEIVGEHVYSELIDSPRSTIVSQDEIKKLNPNRSILKTISAATSYVNKLRPA